MTTATTSFLSQGNSSQVAATTLLSLITAFFELNVRSTADSKTTADQSDAAYHYGM